jgi:GNAT superfamily N-acetyltransferase
VAHYLAWGKVLYIDDLVTHPDEKNKGMGGALLDWLLEQAKQQACDEVHLDTGFQRHDAHRLYLNKGFKLACHHMSVALR